jgi:hypothetical protein
VGGVRPAATVTLRRHEHNFPRTRISAEFLSPTGGRTK